MNYTRTALGLLSAQYRSVLKKCFLINLGLFALGALPANASIDDYKGVTYTGWGTDLQASSFHYQWTQDADTGVYKLHRLTDATGADISTQAQDERIYDYDVRIPGYPDTLDTIDGAVYGGAGDTYDAYHIDVANSFFSSISDYDEAVRYIKNTAYIGYRIDNTSLDDYYPAGAAITNINVLTSIDATFIGNYVTSTSDNPSWGSGVLNFNGSAYGGAIYNSEANFYSAFGPGQEGYGEIGSLSGKFIANGVIITNPGSGSSYTWTYVFVPSEGYQTHNYYYLTGAFGGAIANQYGTIGAINNAVFENNYAVSTANNGNSGDVGGATIFNSVYAHFWSGHGYQYPTSHIGDITAEFNENVANTKYGDVMGGTILNWAGIGTASIGNINSNFSKNSAISQSGDIYGGVIANMLGDDSGAATIASISGTFKENTGSATNIYGGVIYNDGEITNGIKNASFTDNTFTATTEGLGAAIYTDQDLTIAADNGKTLFKGNKINDVANAVYVDNADLTISATNNGTATFYDTIDGENASVTVTGDATGTVNLYNDISNSDVSVDTVNVSTADGSLHNYSLKTLTADANAKWEIDINAKNKTADTFATAAGTTVASGGMVTLSELNYVDSEKSDIGEGFKVQVLKTQGTVDAADLQLTLSDDLTEKFVISQKEETVVDEVTANTKWADEFNKTDVTIKTEGQFGLATTDTLNDSIGVTVSTDSTEVKEKLGDTLMLVNTAQLDEKNFTADKASDVYKAEDDLGTTYGKLTINGKDDGSNKSTIDLDGHDGFEVASGAGVTLTDTALTDNKGKSLIDVAAGGKMSLRNAEINGVNLNVDGELAAANNPVSAKKAVFGKDAVLKLNVNNIKNDYGVIKADSFDIADGATIDITFGQNPLDGAKTGEVALLALNNGSDIDNNNFKDVFHNNMYNFERKSDKSGIYGVYQNKTAREVSEESGGTENNQDTAGAWVDGPSHPNPAAQALADDLARLAQTNGEEFNKALTALAPNDDGMAQSALIDLTDRLLLTVDNHLINSFMESGVASGDSKKTRGYPDLSGVKSWVKTYFAKSKMKNHGDIYGYNAKDKGFIAGVDKKVASGTKVGIGVQFDDTDVDAFQRDVNIQTLQGYVYGEYRPSSWFVNGVLSYGTTDYDEDKNVIGHKINAHYKANIYSVQGLTGYTFKYFTPELGARYYRIKRHGYVDGAMQSVSGNDMDLLRTTLGVKAETNYGRFKPNAYAGIMYDVISDSDDAVVTLGNGESYTVNGKKMPRFGVEIGVGSAIALTDHIEIGIGYEAKFRKKYQDHSGWMSFKYAF